MQIGERTFLRLPYRVRRWLSNPLSVRCTAGAATLVTRPVVDIEAWQPNWMSEMLRQVLADRAGTFIDVGVNRLSTYLDLRAFDTERRYVGLEPNLTCAAIAAEAFRLSGDRHAVIVPCAASATNGVLDLWLRRGADFDSCATTIKDLRPDLEVERMVSAALTLDQIFDSMGLTEIALIKIDVEGSELDVILGAARTIEQRRPPIACEVLLRDASADEAPYAARNRRLVEFLESMSYRILHIRKDAAAQRMLGLTPMFSFPDRVWTRADQEGCDYLFLPEEAIPDRLQRLIDT